MDRDGERRGKVKGGEEKVYEGMFKPQIFRAGVTK